MLDDESHRLRVLTPHLPSPAPVLRRLNAPVLRRLNASVLRRLNVFVIPPRHSRPPIVIPDPYFGHSGLPFCHSGLDPESNQPLRHGLGGLKNATDD